MGTATLKARLLGTLLRELAYKVETVNVSKVYNIILEATSAEAETKADEMCKRLLANPTKDKVTQSRLRKK